MRCERLEVLLPDQKPPEVRDKFLEEEGSCTVNNVKRSPGARLSCDHRAMSRNQAGSREPGAGCTVGGWGGHTTSEMSLREGQNSGVRSRAREETASMECTKV